MYNGTNRTKIAKINNLPRLSGYCALGQCIKCPIEIEGLSCLHHCHVF